MFNTAEAQRRLIACGLTTTQSTQICQLIQKWITNSGEQYTVDRVKLIKQNLARHFAGLPPLPKEEPGKPGSTWVATRGGIPTGPFGSVFRMSRSNFWKAWNALMVYTGVMFLDPDVKATPVQLAKMHSAVERLQPEVGGMTEGLRYMYVSPLKFSARVARLDGDPLVRFQYSETRRAPVDYRTLPEKEAVLSSVQYLQDRPYWTKTQWQMIRPSLEGIHRSVEEWIDLRIEDDNKSGPEWDSDELPWMGVLALIPEPGLKLRFAANPGRIYQAISGPLGRKLFGLLKGIPNDFTYDQDGGIRFVQRKLAEGLPSVSMDLSNATDNFPLELELALLADRGCEPEWLHLFRDLCRGDWYYQKSTRGAADKKIAWTVGSPLGLFPTFAAFALAHHALVQALFEEVGVAPDENGLYDYAIVGDDCTILNREVAERYQKVMSALGVPISASKTLDADHTSEFLGRIITPTEVYQGFKWKGRCSDMSFVDLARNLGPASLVLMRKRQRDVIRVIASLPEPLGLGWNPAGLSWSERVGPWLDELLKDQDERTRSFQRAAAHTYQLMYSSEWFSKPANPYWRADGEILTSDQDVEGLYQYLSPSLLSYKLGSEVWPNFLEIALLRGDDPGTLTEFRALLRDFSSLERVKDVPTLVRWERKIRRISNRS